MLAGGLLETFLASSSWAAAEQEWISRRLPLQAYGRHFLIQGRGVGGKTCQITDVRTVGSAANKKCRLVFICTLGETVNKAVIGQSKRFKPSVATKPIKMKPVNHEPVIGKYVKPLKRRKLINQSKSSTSTTDATNRN